MARDPSSDLDRFAHPAERSLARIFDAHGIRWEYEPHTFVLRADEDGNTLEAVAPDFFLPDLGVYVECTVMRQSGTRRKNRKFRKLCARYGVIATILYRRDFERMRDVYGLPIMRTALDPDEPVTRPRVRL